MMTPLGKDRAKKLAKLLTPKGRRSSGMTVLDSVPLVEEGIKHGLVEELIVLEGCESPLIGAAADAGIIVTPCSHKHFDKLCEVKSSPGLVAIARLPDVLDPSSPDLRIADKRFVVYLDQINDPGNLGTIARSAAAFGCDFLLLSPDCADPFSPKCLRASAGALLRLETARGFLEPRSDWPVFYRAVSQGGVNPSGLNSSSRCGLWLGNEGHGPREAGAGLDVVDVTIPMDSATESLNVNAAASILSFVLAQNQRGRGDRP